MQRCRIIISSQVITVLTSMWKRVPIWSFFHPIKYDRTKLLSEINSNLCFLCKILD